MNEKLNELIIHWQEKALEAQRKAKENKYGCDYEKHTSQMDTLKYCIAQLNHILKTQAGGAK